MPTDVLVTGGAGFIGSQLVARLATFGNRIKVLDNCFRGSRNNLSELKGEVELVEGDIRDFDLLVKIAKDVDIVFHLAAVNGTRYFYEVPELVLDVNVNGTFKLLESIKRVSLKRLVFVSSSEVYGHPQNFPTEETHCLQIMDITNPRYSYASSKIVGEAIVVNYARRYGIPFTILRYHNVYGPRMGFEHVIPQLMKRIILNEKMIVKGDGSQIRSFCYISDAIEGTILASTRDEGMNQIFNIGNDRETTINELVQLLFRVSGKEVKLSYDPCDPELKGSPRRRQPSIKKAQKMLGYCPKVPLEEGLGLTYQWYSKLLVNGPL